MRTFAEVFGRASEARGEAPGRVNLLGEHTDYNHGFVLPTTIPQRTVVECARSPDSFFRFHAANLDATVQYASGETVPRGFARYVVGCIEVLASRGWRVPPVLLHIVSDVPMGSGLSSSAALEVAVLRTLRQLYALPFDDVEMAQLAQRAEIEYAGIRCGILDQMAVSLGHPDHMLFLDTRTLERRLLPLPPNSDLIVIDSGIPRTLATSGYNERRAECEAAAELLGIPALRDERTTARSERLPEPLNRRARHVITENERVLAAAQGVSAEVFGQLMNASHASLRDDYEVSIAPLDLLVQLLQDHSHVHGARLTGAGFGGACVALAQRGAPCEVKNQVLDAYRRAGHEGYALV